MDIPINVLNAFLKHPDWIAETIVFTTLIFFFRWWRRRPKTIFHKLLKKFPSIANSETLTIAEKEAFGDLKKFILDGARVDVLSYSRIIQLKKIRSDLSYIQKELSGKRFRQNLELRQVWEYSLHKAAAHIADDYRFDDLADKIAKMRNQLEKLNSPEET
jgi:hypothetical protein